jgi:hypothetical protein
MERHTGKEPNHKRRGLRKSSRDPKQGRADEKSHAKDRNGASGAVAGQPEQRKLNRGEIRIMFLRRELRISGRFR